MVATPVFLYSARVNSKALAKSPLMRLSPERRWLTYLTLAIAAGVLAGDSINLVYNVLSGEVTFRFLLKALTIGGISGTVYFYYLSDLRRDEQEVGQ